MSAVINKAKQQYRYALRLEIVLLVLLACVGFVWQWQIALSLWLGSLASFLPHCLFTYWIFFRQSAKNQSKMTAFYRAEGLKWLFTIGLIVAIFKGVPQLHFIAFFVGYFFALLLNITLPIFLQAKSRAKDN